jgi:hypothetical protein
LAGQRDGLDDIEATRERWREFGEAFDTRATAEARLLFDARANLLLRCPATVVRGGAGGSVSFG